MPDLSPPIWIGLAVALVLVYSYFRGRYGHPEEARILQGYAERTGARFVPGTSGGPAVLFDAGDAEGKARFREGNRRYRLPRHLRVRLPLDVASDVRVRIVPKYAPSGKHAVTLAPTPMASGTSALDDRYDLHASPGELLHAVLDAETTALLEQRFPNLWIAVKSGEVEIRLGGNPSGLLIETAVGIAARCRERVLEAMGRPGARTRE